MKKMYAFWTCSNFLKIPNPMGFFCHSSFYPFFSKWGLLGRISDFFFWINFAVFLKKIVDIFFGAFFFF
jgi:hypothetical protein